MEKLHIISSSLSRISRMVRGGVLFYIGEIKNLAFFKLERFQKTFKNQWKN